MIYSAHYDHDTLDSGADSRRQALRPRGRDSEPGAGDIPSARDILSQTADAMSRSLQGRGTTDGSRPEWFIG